MCVAVPVEVVKIIEHEALVNFGGVKKYINIDLIEKLKVGDYVLLHAGCAIQKLDKEEADKTLALFEVLSDTK